MSRLKFDVAVETLRLAEPFRISGFCFETADVVYVTLDDGTHRGRGESAGVYYMHDDLGHMTQALQAARAHIEAGPTRQQLRHILPPGGARAAVDAALWELEALRAGTTAWRLAGLSTVHPVRTTLTVSADTVEAMTARAVKYAQAKAIKVKLTGELDLDLARVRSIRAARPDVWMGVDANQGYSVGQLPALVRGLCEQRVLLLEQPLPRGREADLQGFDSVIPIAADESVLSLEELPRAVGRFDVINIKLDKCGGLTEGLMMAEAARGLGLEVMVGTMIGTSLATAPAFILAQQCSIVDLDGPTFLVKDRSPAVVYRDGDLFAGDDVWGAASAVAA
jgi:L-Ala-D/L-Glu epimerase / N-acetyl-D-glutamate racemase